MQTVFMKYNGENTILEEDHGFRIVDPRRDFRLGGIWLNIAEDSILKSRRMIILLTRYGECTRINENQKYANERAGC